MNKSIDLKGLITATCKCYYVRLAPGSSNYYIGLLITKVGLFGEKNDFHMFLNVKIFPLLIFQPIWTTFEYHMATY